MFTYRVYNKFSSNKWVIVSNEGFWSTNVGWVTTKGQATKFSSNERDLPSGHNVEWKRLSEVK